MHLVVALKCFLCIAISRQEESGAMFVKGISKVGMSNILVDGLLASRHRQDDT